LVFGFIIFHIQSLRLLICFRRISLRKKNSTIIPLYSEGIMC
jgi:hypothetical protein